MITSAYNYNQKQNPTHHCWISILGVIFACVICSSCTQKEHITQHAGLQAVETALWERTFAAGEEILHAIDTNQLTEEDKMIWHLYQEEFDIQNNKTAQTRTHINPLLAYFTQQNMYRYAGQAYFILGKLQNWQNNEEEAMLILKLAEENLLKSIQPPPHLLADLYSEIAMCYKAIGLHKECRDNCEKSIYYAQQAQNPYFISAAYKLIANTYNSARRAKLETIPLEDIISLYDSALHYNSFTFKPTGNYHIIGYNRAYALQDTTSMILHSKYLINRRNFYLPADMVVTYYLNHNELDSAKYYLDKLAMGTINQPYNTRLNTEMYYYLEARYLAMTGHTQEANTKLLQLYQDFVISKSKNEDVRTYAISRKYDVEKEQRERLEVEVEKQRLWLSLLVTIGGVVVLLLVFFVYREHIRRTQTQLEATNKLQTQHIEALRKELEIKRENLQKNLLQRIELTQQLHLQQMKQKDKQEQAQLPPWIQQFVDSQLLTNDALSQTLCQEFDGLYYNMLTSLRADYARLTQADILMCVLIMLQLSIADVCVLLSVPKQTVWNRRTRMKEHLGLGNEIDLEQWLKDYALHLALQQH